MKKILSLVLVLAMIVVGSAMLSLYSLSPDNVFVYNGITYVTSVHYDESGNRVATVVSCQGEKTIFTSDGEHFRLTQYYYDEIGRQIHEEVLVSTCIVEEIESNYYPQESTYYLACFEKENWEQGFSEVYTIRSLNSNLCWITGRSSATWGYGFTRWSSIHAADYNWLGHRWELRTNTRSYIAWDRNPRDSRQYAVNFATAVDRIISYTNTASGITTAATVGLVVGLALAFPTKGVSLFATLLLYVGGRVEAANYLHRAYLWTRQADTHYDNFFRASSWITL